MDIMDSTDTPTGGLDGSTASASASRQPLPLSVDERGDATSPTRPSAAGTQPTHRSDDYTQPADSRASAVSSAAAQRADEEWPPTMPTSTDDVMMHTRAHDTQPSLLSSSSAASPSTSASASMQHVKDSARETASSAKTGAQSLADSAASTAKSAVNSVESGLHGVEERAKEAYHDVAERLHHKSEPESPHLAVRFAARPEATDKHPSAASIRDAHLHAPMTSLPTHANEVRADAPTHVSATYQSGLDAAAAAQAPEPKDASASGVTGVLSSIHSKLESGVESVKAAVDRFAEEHLRSSPRDGDHLSSAQPRDLPTLVDPTNEYNNSRIAARMHPAQERAGSSLPDDSDKPAGTGDMSAEEELMDASV